MKAWRILGLASLAAAMIGAPLANARIDAQTAAGIWLFDEGKGDVAGDLSGNENHGTLQGVPSAVRLVQSPRGAVSQNSSSVG